MDQDSTWYGGRPRPRRHNGDPAPLPTKRGQSPQFSAHVYCGQAAERIKMPLGTEVGIGPGNIVLHGDPPPPAKGAQQPPLFCSCLCGHGRPSQLLLSSCNIFLRINLTNFMQFKLQDLLRQIGTTRSFVQSKIFTNHCE